MTLSDGELRYVQAVLHAADATIAPWVTVLHSSQHLFCHKLGAFVLSVIDDVEDADSQRTLVRQLRECIDVLATLACCRGFGIDENVTFWSELWVAINDGLDEERLRWDDGSVFPKFEVSMADTDLPVAAQLAIFRELFHWEHIDSSSSDAFREAMAVLQSRVRHPSVVSFEVSLRVSCDADANANAMASFFDQIRTDTVFSSQAPRYEAASFCLVPGTVSLDYSCAISRLDNAIVLSAARLLRECSHDIPLSIKQETVTDARSTSNLSAHSIARHNIGHLVMASRDQAGVPRFNFRFERLADLGTWEASCFCAAFRSCDRTIPSLQLLAVSPEAMCWLVFGLLDQASRVHVKRLVLTTGNHEHNPAYFQLAAQVLSSPRPGEVMIPLSEDVASLPGIEFAERGTWAAMATSKFPMTSHISALRSQHDHVTTLEMDIADDNVQLEVLAISHQWVGVNKKSSDRHRSVRVIMEGGDVFAVSGSPRLTAERSNPVVDKGGFVCVRAAVIRGRTFLEPLRSARSMSTACACPAAGVEIEPHPSRFGIRRFAIPGR